MVALIVKNLKEVAGNRQEVQMLIDEKKSFFDSLFKKYGKNVTFEVIFDHSGAVYKVSSAMDLKSKKVLLVEEDKDVLKALTTLMSKFKKAVKKQYELEKKEYEYKRKR